MSVYTNSQLEEALYTVQMAFRMIRFNGPKAPYILALLTLKKASDLSGESRAHKTFSYDIPKNCRWVHLLDHQGPIAIKLNESLKALEDLNPMTLRNLSKVDFRALSKDPEELDKVLRVIISDLSTITFTSEEIKNNVLIKNLLDYLRDKDLFEKGTKFTPRSYNKLLMALLHPVDNMNIVDPFMQNGQFLSEVSTFIEENGGDLSNVHMMGFSGSYTSSLIARLNFFINDIYGINIIERSYLSTSQENYLPSHILDDYSNIKKFDVVLSYIPRTRNSTDFLSTNLATCGQFQMRSGFSLIQHATSMISNDGKAGFITPDISLSSKGKEVDIRKELINADLIETVVSIPKFKAYGSLYGDSILIINRQKSPEMKGKVMFVDIPSTGLDQKGEISDEMIQKIITDIDQLLNTSGFSKLVSLAEILDNHYDLLPTLYVRKPQDASYSDVQATFNELLDIRKRKNELLRSISKHLENLGYDLEKHLQ